MPDAPLFLIAASVVLLFSAWAGWNVGGRRNRKPPILPDRVWLCDACKSFNDPTHVACYRCHRPRSVDAREVEPDPEFKIDQQLGRSKSSLDWGPSSPWLAAEEPLRDAWLSERARPTEAALAASEPDPEFWIEPPQVLEPAPPADDPDDAPLASSLEPPAEPPTEGPGQPG
jgi:hypothetical protein